MSRIAWLLASILLLAGDSIARAQQDVVIQLPTFSYFTVSTTVSIPDSGGAYVGGIRRSSTGFTAFGPSSGPRSRAIGGDRSAMTTGVKATVHHFDVLDQQITNTDPRQKLRQPGARKAGLPSVASDSVGSGSVESGTETDEDSSHSTRADVSTADRAPLGSVAAARRQLALEREALNHEALENVRLAEKAAAAGKPKVARYYYQMAARGASGELKADVQKRLRSISATPPRGK